MTNDELLAKNFPKQIDRIRRLARAGFLQKEPTTNAPNTLASAFDWASTVEGLEYWNDLYEYGPR